MNDPVRAIGKLETLLEAAIGADTEGERAAIFSAARWLIADLEAHCAERLYELGENIERARWGICAILGYDITNGQGKEQLRSMASGALIFLRGRLFN